MPVRKLPKNYLVTTGRIARGPNQNPAGLEGPLEQNYLILLHDDPTVESFEEQPVMVPVLNGRPYTRCIGEVQTGRAWGSARHRTD